MLGWLALGIAMLVSVVVAVLACMAGLMRVSRKGYPLLAVMAFAFAALGMGMVGLNALVAITPFGWAPTLVLVPLVVLAVPSAALAAIPRRPHRRIFAAERVSFPYARVGRVLFVLGAAGTVALITWGWGEGMPLWLLLVLLCCGGFVSLLTRWYFANVLAEPSRAVRSFGDVLAADSRPPVLFMRAFDREGQAFVRDAYSRYRSFSEQPLGARGNIVHITLDDYLHRTVEDRIGPFLALGNPADYFTPVGATRAYFKDETWMEEFAALAQRAGCLLLDAGESSNLTWELQFIKTSGLTRKLVVIAGHPASPYRSFWLRLASRLAGVPPVEWDDFARTLSTLGYELPPGEPALGSVVAFDDAARGHLLTSNADLPESFVSPIARWLEEGVSEPSASAACRRCGRQLLVPARAAKADMFCRVCIDGPPLRKALSEVAFYAATILVLPAVVILLALASNC